MCLFTCLPYIENLSESEGYILNIYTLSKQSKRGDANQILDAIIKYSKQNNIKRLCLNSSEQGKNVYMKKGFTKKEDEMELFL